MDRSHRVAWAAGFFDGEGSIGFYRQSLKNNKYALRLTVEQVNPRPLLEMKELLGGYLFLKKRNNPAHAHIWMWRINGAARIRDAFIEMLPYLQLKRPQGELAIEASSLLTERVGRKGFSPEDVLARQAMHARFKTLNQKGITKEIIP